MACRLSHSLSCRRYLLSSCRTSDWLISRGCVLQRLYRPLCASATTNNSCVAKSSRSVRSDYVLVEDCSVVCSKLPVDFTVHSPLGVTLDDVPPLSMNGLIRLIGQDDVISPARLVDIEKDVNTFEGDETVHRILEQLSNSGYMYMEELTREGSCNNVSSGGKGSKEVTGGIPDSDQRPNMDRLYIVKDYLVQEIPHVLIKRHEYRMYSQDVIFENNWKFGQPVTVVGLTAYAIQLFKARCYFHGKYARVFVHVLSASIDEVGGSVTIRWRVEGLPQIKAFMFWKFLPFRVKQKAKEESEWIDGLSTFYVNKKGFIYKHRLDRMMPDKDAAKVVTKPVTPLGVH